MSPALQPDEVLSTHAQTILRAGVSVAMHELIRAQCVEGRLVIRGTRGQVIGLVVIVNGEDHARAVSAQLDTLSKP